ncbi:hypothetical protein [Amycolatopsis sulphurea]|uniref:hypothetical protein n=1 Tax=Amycolatopsis sulphurea TaxID=76022 RepID=UPI001FE68581|nr:hypothetical protein [Amycolatopsis sulphurea]
MNDGSAEPEWRREVHARITLLAEDAEWAGLVLLHENCTGWAGTNAERTLELLAAAVPSVQVLFDTGNGITHG